MRAYKTQFDCLLRKKITKSVYVESKVLPVSMKPPLTKFVRYFMRKKVPHLLFSLAGCKIILILTFVSKVNYVKNVLEILQVKLKKSVQQSTLYDFSKSAVDLWPMLAWLCK